MPKEEAVRKVPEGYGTVTPWIITHDTAGLIGFLQRAFGAEEVARIHNEDGTIGHAEVRIGDSMVMMFDGKPEWPKMPAFMRLYVDNAPAVHDAALAAGASSVTEVTELFWGDRIGRVRDPFGNVWWIQERLEELALDEIQRRASDPGYVEAMQYVQGADIYRTDD